VGGVAARIVAERASRDENRDDSFDRSAAVRSSRGPAARLTRAGHIRQSIQENDAKERNALSIDDVIDIIEISLAR
jgi:hypothetical protein